MTATDKKKMLKEKYLKPKTNPLYAIYTPSTVQT